MLCQKILVLGFAGDGLPELIPRHVIGVKGGTQVAPKLPGMGHVLGKGRFAVGVAQRLRAGGPAPDPRSVSVRPSVTPPGSTRNREKCEKVRFSVKLRNFIKFKEFQSK